MLKTEPELYRVHGKKQNHVWLEVLEGPDTGVRVSVPKYSSAYSAEVEQKVTGLSTGSVHVFVLESESKSPPQWRVHSVKPRSTLRSN